MMIAVHNTRASTCLHGVKASFTQFLWKGIFREQYYDGAHHTDCRYISECCIINLSSYNNHTNCTQHSDVASVTLWTTARESSPPVRTRTPYYLLGYYSQSQHCSSASYPPSNASGTIIAYFSLHAYTQRVVANPDNYTPDHDPDKL